MEIFSSIIMLVIIMDPFGNLVLINSLLSEFDAKKRQKIMLRESIIAFFILILCALCGENILKFLGLEQPALRISGGIILFLVALGMVFPKKSFIETEKLEDPLIVPIAMPFIAGPSTISIVFLMSHQGGSLVYLAVLAACVITTVILFFSPAISRLLGKRGAIAVERLTGMLLIMISVQALLTGFKEYFS
jgi:multiple antibiotic resistance protein